MIVNNAANMNDCILRKLKINSMNLGDDLWLTTQMILNFAIASPKLKVLETLVKPASKIIWRTFKNTYTQTIFFFFLFIGTADPNFSAKV